PRRFIERLRPPQRLAMKAQRHRQQSSPRRNRTRLNYPPKQLNPPPLQKARQRNPNLRKSGASAGRNLSSSGPRDKATGGSSIIAALKAREQAASEDLGPTIRTASASRARAQTPASLS